MYRVLAGKREDHVHRQMDKDGRTDFYKEDDAVKLFFDCISKAEEKGWDYVAEAEYYLDCYGQWRAVLPCAKEWMDGVLKKNGKAVKR